MELYVEVLMESVYVLYIYYSCLNGAVCRSTDGVCLCPDGYTGVNCELQVGIIQQVFKLPLTYVKYI